VNANIIIITARSNSNTDRCPKIWCIKPGWQSHQQQCRSNLRLCKSNIRLYC